MTTTGYVAREVQHRQRAPCEQGVQCTALRLKDQCAGMAFVGRSRLSFAHFSVQLVARQRGEVGTELVGNAW